MAGQGSCVWHPALSPPPSAVISSTMTYQPPPPYDYSSSSSNLPALGTSLAGAAICAAVFLGLALLNLMDYKCVVCSDRGACLGAWALIRYPLQKTFLP